MVYISDAFVLCSEDVDDSLTLSEVTDHPELSYVTQSYKNGELCDLTQEPREVMVRVFVVSVDTVSVLFFG